MQPAHATGVGDIPHYQKHNTIFPVMDLPANDPSTHYRGKSPDFRINGFSCRTMTNLKNHPLSPLFAEMWT